ncbi:MAG: DUF1887 family protein, partial [Pseudomonadota bacterium]|nr:DUF1887 family protein [Pseudomonadota bacterium]
MSDTKGEMHVCLVSDHLLPNLILVLMDHPERVVAVATEDMERKGLVRRFQRLLEDRGVAVDLRTGAPSAGLPKLLDFALQLAGELEGRRVVLNA